MEENNLNEEELSLKEIFEIMKTNIYDNYYNYSFSSINKDYLTSRKTLFNNLHKITIKMGFKSQTFFLCIHYLDIIFTQKRRINNNFNLLGLACLCLSAKFCEIDPNVPHLQYFVRIFNNIISYKNIISMSDLKKTEILVLKILNYKLNYYTIYDFNSFIFSHVILKIGQIKDIQNKNRKYYSKKKKISINSSYSLLMKNISEKIYKKSRHYLDNIINNTKLCFKYNPLYLSIYIMKKSIEEILEKEQKIAYLNDKKQQEFYCKTNLYFKQIMLYFYKIDFEKNEQYLEIIDDDEIFWIFERKNKNEEDSSSSKDKRLHKDNEKLKHNKKDIDIDINNNPNINNEIDKTSDINSTYSNGFYNKLKIKTNYDNFNKKQKQKILYISKKENINNNINNNYNPEEDDLNKNLNINKLKNIKWNKKNNLNNAKSVYNIHSNCKKENQKEEFLSDNNNIINKKYLISSNRYLSRTGTYNNIQNSNIVNKKNLYNKNDELIYTVNTYRGNKVELNSNDQALKTEKNSPCGTNNENNYCNYTKMNKNIKLKRLNNTGNERNDYTYNINDANSNNNFLYNTTKKCDKKLYFKKLIYTNAIENLSSANRNGISSYFYSNNYNSEVDIKKNNKKSENNEMCSLNKNKADINNKEVVGSKISSFYSRFRLKGKNNENNLSKKIINNMDEVSKSNTNDLNDKKQEITIFSSKYRQSFYTNKNTVNDHISDEMKKNEPLIINNKNKNEIESYNQSNSKTINSSIFHTFSSKNIFKRKNKILNINLSNTNIVNLNEIKDNNKNITSRNFHRSVLNHNKITVNITRENENKNDDENKTYEPSISMAYVLFKNNSELSKILKEINKERAKNIEKQITVNTINSNGTLKVNKSIRHKYLNLNKNKTINNTNNDINNLNESKTISNFNEKEDKSTKNINNNDLNLGNNNSIINMIKSKYSSKNIISKKNENNNTNKNMNNKNRLLIRVSDIESRNKYKNFAESSINKIVNKTKTLLSRNNKKEEIDSKKLENDEKNKKYDKNLNLNFYKSQINFYNATKQNEDNIKSYIEKEEIKKNLKYNNSTYLKNFIDKNKIKINNNINKDNPISQTYKNSSTIVINNNLNYNFDNKTNSINNDYIKYKTIYKKNKDNLDNNIKIDRNEKNGKNDKINNIVDNENTLSNFLNKYNIHPNNANKNSCINNVTISNINKHHEKNMLFYKK